MSHAARGPTLAVYAFAVTALALAACLGGANAFAWPEGMPRPRSEPEAAGASFRVYVWNRGLGELVVEDSRGGVPVHVQPAETGVLHLYGQGYHRIMYGGVAAGSDTTALSFVPTAEHPCWVLVISGSPQLSQSNPMPVDCP